MTGRHTPWPRIARIADELILSALLVTTIVLLLASAAVPWRP